MRNGSQQSANVNRENCYTHNKCTHTKITTAFKYTLDIPKLHNSSAVLLERIVVKTTVLKFFI